MKTLNPGWLIVAMFLVSTNVNAENSPAKGLDGVGKGLESLNRLDGLKHLGDVGGPKLNLKALEGLGKALEIPALESLAGQHSNPAEGTPKAQQDETAQALCRHLLADTILLENGSAQWTPESDLSLLRWSQALTQWPDVAVKLEISDPKAGNSTLNGKRLKLIAKALGTSARQRISLIPVKMKKHAKMKADQIVSITPLTPLPCPGALPDQP